MVPTEATQIMEEQIATTLELAVNGATPKSIGQSLSSKESSKTIKKSLDQLFPEQQYDDKDIQKVKDILGPLATKFSASELRDIVAETQFLVGSWLDDFEREIFNGLTLNELLHEKGGL